MTDWTRPLTEALEQADNDPVFFFRDDDGGWDDARLAALLDRFERAALPIDVAVIPQALHAELATALCRRHDATGGLVGCHQHGYAHRNHQVEGRKCEFGPARSAAEQTADLAAGRARLQQALGARLDPIFTPPWNRCTEDTTAALARLGVQVLSRDAGAQPLALHGLAELPVAVDWCKRIDERKATPEEQVQRITAAMRRHATVGIMLHHPVMDDDELDALDTIFAVLKSQPRTRVVNMRAAATSLPR
jgi:predicted deacetylase